MNLFYYDKIRTIYCEKLSILDDEIFYITWDEIVSRLKMLNPVDNQINIYNINNVITHNENFLIAMLRNNIITLSSIFNLNKWLEWNILFSTSSSR